MDAPILAEHALHPIHSDMPLEVVVMLGKERQQGFVLLAQPSTHHES